MKPLIYNSESDSVSIVPESNILLKDIKSRVVFRIPAQFYNEASNYFITDDNLAVLKEVNVNKGGFAEEEIAFRNIEEYYLMIQTKSGDSMFKAFPEIKSEGTLTGIKKSNNQIIYTIQTKGETNIDLTHKVSVFSGDYRNLYNEDVLLKEPVTSLFLQNEIFVTGINYIVLFNSTGKLEKINSLFYSPLTTHKISVELEKESFSCRDSINAVISLNNEADKLSYVSIAVSLHGTKKEDHIFIPELYLANPIILQNYLENNDKVDAELQSRIMILFDKEIDKEVFLNEVNRVETPKMDYIPEIRGSTISGKLRDKKTKELISNHNVYLSVLFNNPQFHAVKTGKNGEFIFPLNSLTGINDVFLCAEPDVNTKREYEIIINNSFSSSIASPGLLPTFVNETEIELIKEIYINSQIQQKLYPAKIQDEHKRKKVGTFNINNNIKTTYIEDYIKLKNMEEVFFEIFPFVKYKENQGQYSFRIYNDDGILLPGEPLLMVDRIPIFNSTKIRELDITKIEKVEVINKTYYLGSHTFQGVIMLTTNTNDFAGIKAPNSGVFLEYPALGTENKQNDYRVNRKENDVKIPNFKTVLYWNPNLKLNKGKQSFNFTASDNKGVYDILIKAYNSKGEFYYGKKQITIN